MLAIYEDRQVFVVVPLSLDRRTGLPTLITIGLYAELITLQNSAKEEHSQRPIVKCAGTISIKISIIFSKDIAKPKIG
jgi:hypothetical protein